MNHLKLITVWLIALSLRAHGEYPQVYVPLGNGRYVNTQNGLDVGDLEERDDGQLQFKRFDSPYPEPVFNPEPRVRNRGSIQMEGLPDLGE